MSQLKVLKAIAESNRAKGNTAYILRAALNDPRVCIVFNYRELAENAKERYGNMYKQKYNRLMRFYHKLIKRPMPLFCSTTEVAFTLTSLSRYNGSKPPLVFDLSVIE